MNDKIKNNRQAIKPNWLDLYTVESAKRKGLEKPNKFLGVSNETPKIPLVNEFFNIKQKTLSEVIKLRRSLREYADTFFTFEEFSYLIWETCRVESYRENAVFRTIPTAGASNSMETYVYVSRVEKLDEGIYLYLQDTHQLALIRKDKDLSTLVNDSLLKQLRNAPAVFFFTTIPSRTEYIYDFCAHKIIAIEAGHACQNLSLAAEVIDSGVCAICAYNQNKADGVLNLDGEEQFVIYCATVGKRK